MLGEDGMTQNALKLALISTSMLTTIATPRVALAQEAQIASVPSASEGGIEDIVVTARKRSESIQNIPVAVSAFSEKQIERNDMTSIEKIAAYTPQLTVGRASSGSGAQISMRGIGSNSTSLGIEQSVAVIVDGAYSGQGRVINEGFFDLARVEVMKGPQALFFGKNATAGVVSLATADPTDKLYVKMRGGYEFKAEQVVLEGVVSGPLSDTLGGARFEDVRRLLPQRLVTDLLRHHRRRHGYHHSTHRAARAQRSAPRKGIAGTRHPLMGTELGLQLECEGHDRLQSQ